VTASFVYLQVWSSCQQPVGKSDGGGDVCGPVGAADGWSETGVGHAVAFSVCRYLFGARTWQ
jgi:hypothetical protein